MPKGERCLLALVLADVLCLDACKKKRDFFLKKTGAPLLRRRKKADGSVCSPRLSICSARSLASSRDITHAKTLSMRRVCVC